MVCSKSKYTANKLKQFGIEDCKPRSTPLHANQQLAAEGEKITAPFSEAVGSLLYLAVCTRPDIAHSVSMLSRFDGDPKKTHWQ